MKFAGVIAGVVLCMASSVLMAGVPLDVLEVNGHPGYLTAQEMSPDGVVDKVLVVVKGFDNDNTEHPIDDLNTKYQPVIEELQSDGWDIVVFDYVRGDIDIKQNAENLKHFINYLDGIAVPDYHLALIGGSMGGYCSPDNVCSGIFQFGGRYVCIGRCAPLWRLFKPLGQ